MTAAQFGVRVSAFYVALFLIFGIQLPFLPIWMKARGLTAEEIGIASALPIVIRIAGVPAVTWIADRLGRSRRVIGTCVAGTTATIAGFLLASGFPGILVLTTLFAFFFAPLLPLMDALALAGQQRTGADYGRMRLWGSVSFIAATLIGGYLLQSFSAESIIWLLLGAALLTAIATIFVPTIEAAPVEEGLAGSRDARLLLASPIFLLFALASGLAMSSHAVLYVFGSVHWTSLGYGGSFIGLLWATGVCAEVLLFAVSGRVLANVSGPRLLLAGALAGVVRWLVMAFDPAPWILVPLQTLHAATFALTHLGAMRFLHAAVPQSISRLGQGLYSSIGSGLFMSIAMYLSGLVYSAQGRNAYLFMSGLALVGAAAAALLARLWHGGRLDLSGR